MKENQMKPIIGGIFGTHTEWDENGNVVEKDDFHLRIYWDLWHSGAMKRLKGNMLHVYLTIAMHLDRRGEGWPTQEEIAKLCGINRDTVGTAVKKLTEEGFIEAEKVRTKGKFDNTIYKIKFAPKTNENDHAEKSGTVETPKNQRSHHAEKTVTEKPSRKIRHGKSDTKEDLSFKDPSFKDIDDDSQPAWETDATFQTLRQLFVITGYDDIKKPADHYPQYEKAVQEAGLQKLLIQANKYIQAVQEKRHKHKTAQIVWFLYDGWKNDFDKKEEKPAKQGGQRKPEKKPVDQEKMPMSLRMAQEQPQQPANQENMEEKQRQIQEKLKEMNERFNQRKKREREPAY